MNNQFSPHAKNTRTDVHRLADDARTSSVVRAHDLQRACIRILRPYLVLCIIPLLIIAVSCARLLLTDSALRDSNIGIGVHATTLPGRPTIDPNDGVTSFALGARAANEILSGRLPLWNHFEGFGAPLVGGLQSAALFPPTLLLALPHGQAIEHAVLQFIAGLGAFLFFRRFGLGETAALTGGLLYEVNGVFSWLQNAIFNPVAFFPWLFFVLEGMRAAAQRHDRYGARLPTAVFGGVIGALALTAGFPEEVYLYTLMLVAWAVLRLVDLKPRAIARVLVDGTVAAIVAFALNAPALVPFADFLREANIGGHDQDGFLGRYLSARSLLPYMLPYVYGPIAAWPDMAAIGDWGGIGGYVGFLPVVAAFGALFSRTCPRVAIFLTAWIVVCLGVSHGWPVIYPAFMALPLTKTAACFRYLNASWIFCAIFLSALFLDRIPYLDRRTRQRVVIAATIAAVVCVLFAVPGAHLVLARLWHTAPRLRAFAIGSFALVALAAAWLMLAPKTRPRALAVQLSVALVAEAVAWFLVPFLSYPGHGHLDMDAVAFLQSHVGYQRVLAVKDGVPHGLLPGYTSDFGIPSVNYDNLPVPKRTVDYLRAYLDPYADTYFLSWAPELPPDQQAARDQLLHRRLHDYANVGVKYVMAGPDFDRSLPAVYADPLMTIYELPDPRPYMTAPSCRIRMVSFDAAEADCAAQSTLLRLELFMRGWSATVNGQSVDVTPAEDAFQQITLPAGHARIVFQFWPPLFGTASVVAGMTLLFCVGVFAGWASRQWPVTRPRFSAPSLARAQTHPPF